MTREPFAPTIRTQAQLQDVWRHFMGPSGFSTASLWMMLVVDDQPLPQLTEVTDTDTPPDEHDLDGLVRLLRMLEDEVAPGARFAFLRSRPGGDAVSEEDRAWAAALYDAARRAAVPCEVVHLATRGSVRAIPQDDLRVA